MADENCTQSTDGAHCAHWYDDAGPCCLCGDDTDAGQSDGAPRTTEQQPMEWVPERDDPPAVLDVFKVALGEVDRVVGNETTLGEEDTAHLRRIIFAAFSQAKPPNTDTATRSLLGGVGDG